MPGGAHVSIELALLVLAGAGAGLVGSMAGLASLISYPALLAYGLPPLGANVSNKAAMLAVTAGSALGSRQELRGQGRRLVILMGQAVLGGLLGAALLLVTPESAFEAAVPWLVALGSVLLLARDAIRTWALRRRVRLGDAAKQRRWWWPAVFVVVCVYGGYFGAGVGIIMLAVIAVRETEPLAVSNAVKNVVAGASNAAATVAYAFFAPVSWPAVITVGAGMLLGGYLGPRLVRIAPERPLRYLIALGGFCLAGFLAFG